MTKLFLMIGLPGSGKSSLAASLQQTQPGLILISTDAIRARLFGDEAIQGNWGLIQRELYHQLKQAVHTIQQGQATAVIYDATNVRRRYRRQVIALCRILGFTHLTALWVDTPLSLCLKRNQQRQRQVPQVAIERMNRQFLGAPPSLEEGINCLIQYRNGDEVAMPLR